MISSNILSKIAVFCLQRFQPPNVIFDKIIKILETFWENKYISLVLFSNINKDFFFAPKYTVLKLKNIQIRKKDKGCIKKEKEK